MLEFDDIMYLMRHATYFEGETETADVVQTLAEMTRAEGIEEKTSKAFFQTALTSQLQPNKLFIENLNGVLCQVYPRQPNLVLPISLRARSLRYAL